MALETLFAQRAFITLADTTVKSLYQAIDAVKADWPLFVLCLLLFIGTVAASFAPFYWRYKEEYQAQLVSVVGAGLLTGAALQIIIPEGFQAFMQPSTKLPGSATGPPHWLPGFVLTLGFLAMLVLDQVQTRLADPGHCYKLAMATSVEEGRPAAPLDATPAYAVHGQGALPRTSLNSNAPSKVVVGLVIHAAADGLSLGAASVTGNHRLELVVTIAMVLHKMPVALGLATYLRQARTPWRQVRRWLIAFSAATPVMTLLTFWVLALLPGGGAQEGDGWLVPCFLLFSGGTVLYAACMHILPELMGPHGGGNTLTPLQVLLFVGGAMVPLCLAALPHHHD